MIDTRTPNNISPFPQIEKKEKCRIRVTNALIHRKVGRSLLEFREELALLHTGRAIVHLVSSYMLYAEAKFTAINVALNNLTK